MSEWDHDIDEHGHRAASRGRRTAGRRPPAIDPRGVREHFGRVRAVRGIDMTVAPGEIVALLGRQPAGARGPAPAGGRMAVSQGYDTGVML